MVLLLNGVAIVMGVLALLYALRSLLPASWWMRLTGQQRRVSASGCGDCKQCPSNQHG